MNELDGGIDVDHARESSRDAMNKSTNLAERVRFGTFELNVRSGELVSVGKIGKATDDGHVQIKTILLDEIFGFDPDVRLAPTNAFHVGFWFDNPQDAAALSTCHFDPTKPTPFNGEHKAGPFAMLSVPDAKSGLGPLCTDPNNSTVPATCTL